MKVFDLEKLLENHEKYEHDIDEWTHGILWNVVDVVTDATTVQKKRESLFVLSQVWYQLVNPWEFSGSLAFECNPPNTLGAVRRISSL